MARTIRKNKEENKGEEGSKFFLSRFSKHFNNIIKKKRKKMKA
jgi:hypothetical protein